ncbi:mitochondrial PGP phosphatase [Lipomyces japonicus]|uniref:mitochondrial PGP phosphatase n=1 Tax=Lipomyces japonicus TaxID=56871 RepID=UPI0034CE5C9C
MSFNLPGTLAIPRVLLRPSLTQPHLRIKTFNDLPIPLPFGDDIRGVVLDKDNCFAADKADQVWPAYKYKWELLRKTYPNELVIVSNSAGARHADDGEFSQAAKVEAATGVPVLRHDVKKPGCGEEILKYFGLPTDGSANGKIVVVGDRLLTDVVLANQMGAWAIWVEDGVRPLSSLPVRFERWLFGIMTACGVQPVHPTGIKP